MQKIFILLIVFSSSVLAEKTYITIPGEGWHVTINGPALTSSKIESNGRYISYLGSSVDTGVSVSVNTELKGSSSNQECFDTFWEKAQRNPTIIKGSELLFKNSTASFVTLQSEGEYKGKPFKTANAHGYFVNEGLCVDVHVSHWPYTVKSDEYVKAIVQSIKVVK
jgi:hypothetical protein